MRKTRQLVCKQISNTRKLDLNQLNPTGLYSVFPPRLNILTELENRYASRTCALPYDSLCCEAHLCNQLLEHPAGLVVVTPTALQVCGSALTF